MRRRWQPEWLLDETEGIPAFDYLYEGVPENVRIQLLAILDAVRTTGPDRWIDPNTHCPMKGALAHLHEVRDKQGETLYRLFVRWLRSEHKVVIIDGREKPNRTRLKDAEYEAIGRLASRIDEDPRPFATGDDFARELLKKKDSNQEE